MNTTEVTPNQKERTAATFSRIIELKKQNGAHEAAGGDEALKAMGICTSCHRRECVCEVK